MKYDKVLTIIGAILFVIGGALLLATDILSNQALTAPGIMVLSLGFLTLAVPSIISSKRK